MRHALNTRWSRDLWGGVLLAVGVSGCIEANLNSANRPPEVAIVAPAEGAVVLPEQEVVLVVQVTDREDEGDELTVTVSSGGSAVLGERTWVGDELKLVPDMPFGPGEHTVTVTAIDRAGASAEDVVAFSVVPNAAPAVAFAAPTAQAVVAAELPVTVRASVGDDADVAAVRLEWRGTGLPVGTLDNAPTAASPTGEVLWTLAGLKPGQVSLTLSATDAQGARAEATVAWVAVVGDTDGDGFVDEGLGGLDCDDSRAEAAPGQPEVCNDLDDNCDGAADEHAVPEVCNGLDDDCDGTADNGASDAPDWYGDSDGDGEGVPTDVVTACEAPDGYVEDSTDCDDSDPAVFADAQELCDGLDNDCSGLRDDGPGTCPCPVEHRGGNNLPYQMCDQSLVDWEAARTACYSTGYHLVTVDSAAENAWLDSTFDLYTTAPFWIGLNDQASEGVWVWEEGSAVSYINWHPGEPNNLANDASDGTDDEDCAELNFWTTGAWNDKDCAVARRYVCEAD